MREPEPDWRAVPDCLARWDAARIAVLSLRDVYRNLLLVTGSVHAQVYDVESGFAVQGFSLSDYYARRFIELCREKLPPAVPELAHWHRNIDHRISLTLREFKSFVNQAREKHHPQAWCFETQFAAFLREEPHRHAKAAIDELMDGYRRAQAARIESN